MANYTTNLCTNPSFETGLTGWSSLSLATIKQDQRTAQFGVSSLSVTTPGVIPGEGVSGPVTTLATATTCSVSLYLMSSQTGTVNIAAVTTNGVIVSSVTVPLAAIFTQVALVGLNIAANGTLQVLVTTNRAQALSFWVDGVQYEPESPNQPYCDGDQLGCFWNGAPELSTSFQPFQFFLADTGTSLFSGSASVINSGLVVGAISSLGDVGVSQFTGNAQAGSFSPQAAVNDFGIFALTDTDPAQTYVSWNDAGFMSGYNDYQLSYGMFVPPLDYPVSGGQLLWKRAAFAAFGWTFASLANGAAQNLTDVQVEFCRINGSAAITPSTFQPPRQLQVSVKPDRINYVPNPSFEVGTLLSSTPFWSATAPGVQLIQDFTQPTPTNVATYASIVYNAGNFSMQVAINSGNDVGAYITIPNLVVGRLYIASAYIMTGSGLDDVIMTIGNGFTDLAGLGGIPYGGNSIAPGYGAGGYGGIQPTPGPPLAPVGWTRISCVFTADADNEQLTIAALVDPASTYPVRFWVDAVLVEDGTILQPYFDGSFGVDTFWQAGQPGLVQSYFTVAQAAKMNMVNNILTRHIPLGISAAPVVFATPFTG